MKFWKWKCEQCGREAVTDAGKLPQPCTTFDPCSESFLKIGEANQSPTQALVDHWKIAYASNPGPAAPAKDHLDKS